MPTISTKSLPTLAGANSGKRVNYVPAIENSIQRLHVAAKQGHYYPLLAIKQLAALTTGMIGKANVFIPPENLAANHALQQFDVYVPGIKARVERRSNDTYVVTYLELSGGWDQLRRANNAPGLYAAAKSGDEFAVTRLKEGKITPQTKRVVVISDGQHESATAAARRGFKSLTKTPFAGEVKASPKFDITFLPTGKSLGGGTQYDPKAVVDSYGCAAIVAHAMMSAERVDDVRWVSEYGGSAVLTQALQILANKNVSLANRDQSLYLYKPTTSRTEAVTLAHKLGLKLDAGHASQAYTPRTILDDLSAKRLRLKNLDDSYSYADYAKSLSTYVAASAGFIGAVAYVPSLPVIAALLGPTAASALSYTGIAAGGISAAGVVATTVPSICEDLTRK